MNNISANDEVKIVGEKGGVFTNIGTFAQHPKDKAVDIVRSYFGEFSSQAYENDGIGFYGPISDEAMYAYSCCLEVIAYIKKHKDQFFDY